MTEKEFGTGITFGAWELFHPGHIAFLRACCARCKNLVIGLHIDPSKERPEKMSPVETVLERWLRLNNFNFAGVNTTIIPYETEADISLILGNFHIDARFLGSDYANDLSQVTGYKLCKEKDIQIVLIPRDHNWSSSGLKKRIYEDMNVVRAA